MGCTTSTNSLRTIQQQNSLPNGNVKESVGALPNGSSSHDSELHKAPPGIDANGENQNGESPLKSPLSLSSSSSSSVSLHNTQIKMNQASADSDNNKNDADRDNSLKGDAIVSDGLPGVPPVHDMLERVAETIEQVQGERFLHRLFPSCYDHLQEGEALYIASYSALN